MSDDIVTRLREGKGDDIALFDMMYEAADEIERLRAELDAEKQTCENWVKVAELMLPYVMASPDYAGKFASWVMTQFTSKAVRNDSID